jgi:hypothetical protein
MISPNALRFQQDSRLAKRKPAGLSSGFYKKWIFASARSREKAFLQYRPGGFQYFNSNQNTILVAGNNGLAKLRS